MRLFLIPFALLSALALTGCMQTISPEKVAEVNESVLLKEGIAALKVGDKAPPFAADTAAGVRVYVASAQGEHEPIPSDEKGAVTAAPDAAEYYTVLYFYPADFTPNSSKHLIDLSNGLEQLAGENIKVYGISTGTADLHRAYMEKQGITVPLLVDTGAIAKSYGALLEGGKYAQRTLVGIKPDGTVGFYRRGFGHMKLVDLILKETGRTPAPAK
jgi:peroxiredoxin